ncbi:MAG: sugar transferase [Vicinamibacterales bacterium]
MAKGLIQTANWRSSTLIVIESALILGAVTASMYAQLGASLGRFDLVGVLPKALVITSVCQLCLYYSDLYDNPRAGGNRTELLVRIMQSLGATCLVLAAIYTLFPALIIARGVVAPAAALVVTGLVTWRLSFAWVSRRVGPSERLLLVGTSAAGLELARELHEREDMGVRIVGFVDVQPISAVPTLDLPFLGGVEDIPAIVRARAVDRVVVSLADARGKLPMQKLLEMKLDGVSFDYLASVYEEYTGKIAVENLRPSWLIFSPGFKKTPRLLAMKRILDLLSAAVGLLLAAPVLLLLAAIIKLTSPGPVFYSQRRVGYAGQVFTVYKLRSMCVDAERDTGPVWAPHGGDARITRIGRFMRRTRLDELPQFWNILVGNMSLVGPRPERPEFVRSLSQQIPFYGQRHVIKPGLTGWAQVRYTYGATVEEAMQKLQYDLFYIKHLSVFLDLFIIFETVKTVLLRRGH